MVNCGVIMSPDHHKIGWIEQTTTKPSSINPKVDTIFRNDYKYDYEFWDAIKTQWKFLNKLGYKVTEIRLDEHKCDGFTWRIGDYHMAHIYYK